MAAAALADRDETLTLPRTGAYAAMWKVAAAAIALVSDDGQAVALTAAQVVPQRWRMRAVLDESLDHVRPPTTCLTPTIGSTTASGPTGTAGCCKR
jgi:hypothetical protein